MMMGYSIFGIMKAVDMYDLEQLEKDFNSGKKLKYLFFWGNKKSHSGQVDQSCLSQWFDVNFEIDGIKYYSSEHYMMAEKAKLFKDEHNYKKILESKSPGQAKQYGREVRGFDEKIWRQNRIEIVKQGNIAKFGQNELLKNYLLSTQKRILVEASPVDIIWGIGLSKDSEHCQNPLKWRGLNLLGFVLMEVRDFLTET